MADLIKGADILDEITITDTNGNLINLSTGIAGLEIWYYTDCTAPIKFSSVDNQSGYNNFVKTDDTHYKAYITSAMTKLLNRGKLYADVYIATTNADLAAGIFVNLGTKDLTINITEKPISAK